MLEVKVHFEMLLICIRATWCHSAEESQATHLIICSSSSSMSSSANGGSSLFHVWQTLACQFSVSNWFDVLADWLLLSLAPSCKYMPHPPNASARDELLLGKEVPLLQLLAEQNCQGSCFISCELLEESQIMV